MRLRFLISILLLLLVCGVGFASGIREERQAEKAVIEQPEDAHTWMYRGVEYYNQGDYINAIECFIKAKDIYEKTVGKDHPDYAQSLNNLGGLYVNMGDYEKAEKFYLESISIIERALGKDHPYYATSLNNLSMSYLSDNKYPQSLEIKKEENRIRTEQIYRNFSFMSEQQREAFWKANSYSFEQVNSITFHHLVPESSTLSYDNALFTKGLLLRTTNAVRDAIYNSGDQELIAQYEDMMRKRRQIANLQQNGGNEEYIKQLEQEAEAMEKALNQASSAYAAANEDLQADLAINWQSIRDNLRPDEAAIEFVSFKLYDKKWTNRTLYAALVLRHGMASPQWVPLCEGSVLDGIYEKLETIFEEKPRWERVRERDRTRAAILYDELGEELYNAVWKPLEETLQGVKTIYYSPSGQLHKISFNALPIGTKPAEIEEYDDYEPEMVFIRLADKYDLNLVSSTREVVYRNRKSASPNSAVVYGGLIYDLDEDTMKQEAIAYQREESRIGSSIAAVAIRGSRGASWDFLPGTVSESEKVQELLKDNNLTVTRYTEANGNKESFLSLDGKKVNIIHLATHGFFVEDAEKDYEQRERFERLGGGQRAFENPLLRSGLILSGGNNAWKGEPVEGVENGILLAADVAQLNLLGAQLVVLSACESALGGVNNSEGVFGLQRAFKLAGAETLIMSLWEVSDDATDLLISGFYENWLSGMTRQEAFKKAQASLRANPDYKEPYFWAAFVLMD